MITCPNCGFSQPDDGYCASCGVDMKSYVPKRSLFSVPVTYMTLLVVTVIVSSFYIYSVVKEHVLEQKTVELSGSKGYSNLSDVAPPTSQIFNRSNIDNNNTEPLVAKKAVVQPFESGDLKIYYVSLASTSPILQNANMISTNSGIISNLASYFTSSDPNITNTINVINMDTWNVPASSIRVAKVFNMSKALPDSDENVGLNFTVEVDNIVKNAIGLQASAIFNSVEAIQSEVTQPTPSQQEQSNDIPIPEELDTEDINRVPEENGIDPANGSIENIAPIITFNTSRQSVSSSMQSIGRGDALFIYNIIPRRELSALELNLMPNIIAGFINQSGFLTNDIDFVIFVEYESQ